MGATSNQRHRCVVFPTLYDHELFSYCKGCKPILILLTYLHLGCSHDLTNLNTIIVTFVENI